MLNQMLLLSIYKFSFTIPLYKSVYFYFQTDSVLKNISDLDFYGYLFESD